MTAHEALPQSLADITVGKDHTIRELQDDDESPEEEQLVYLRRELAEMREELALIREAKVRAIREQITSQAEPSPN